MRSYYFMLAAATALLLTACNNRQETRAGDEVVPDTLTYIADDSEPAPAEERTEFQPRPVTSRPAPQRPRVVRPAPVKAEPETMYVETYGAQGKVWGHVTMNGDTGNGTIHDADENTLTVTCTRHGNELYAVDQNSRRYVFKLKAKAPAPVEEGNGE